MNQDPSFETARARRADIRRLGFDPEQLTSDEQRELLELDARLQVAADRTHDVLLVI